MLKNLRPSACFCALLLLALGVAGGWTLWTLTLRYRKVIYTDPAVVPERPVALVFGAGYWPDGTPSDIMRDRVAAAVELYRAGRVRKILLSGDNRFVHYNEPEKMREVALALGMPEEDIVLDYAGRRTYDTCYRAKAIFGLTEVVVVTQRYHLPRALYTCRTLGLDAVGYVADRQSYVHIRRYWAREVPALWLAWWDLRVRHPKPVLGDPIPIF
ncbi:MAG: YdcF family protein [Thermoflexales bacterium]|nr:YdcF family protein [Thermoflexales bacterium]